MTLTTLRNAGRLRPGTGPGPFRFCLNVAVSVALVAIGVVREPGLLFGLSVAAGIGVSCEILAPLPGDGSHRRSLWAYATDLTHAVGNRYLVLPMVTAASAVVGPLVAQAVPPMIEQRFTRLSTPLAVTGLLVTTDLANYWAHRALHRVPRLWAFHAVHHSTEHLDWLATSRGHPVDLAFNLVVIAIPSFALGQISLAPWILTFFFLYPFACHARARIRIPWVGRVLVTPEFHHWHHAAESRAYDRNFGSLLSIWDRIFGTAIEPGNFPERYGIENGELDSSDYLGHLIAPFRSP